MFDRRLTFVFALLLALQFSWTAVSMYCAHETGRAAQHYGHHQHVEDGDELPVIAKGKQTAPAKFAVHAHCATCHHSIVAIDSFEPSQRADLVGIAPSVPVAAHSSIFSPPPERPQWMSAV